jgi:hypothetical protein
VFARPSYQNRIRHIVGLHRGTPDISLSAAVNGGLLVFMCFAGLAGPGIPDITIGDNTLTFTQNSHTFTVPGFNAVAGCGTASSPGSVEAAKLVAKLAK